MEYYTSHSSSLLPCPCCGSEPVVFDAAGIWDNGVFVECPACGLRTGEAAYFDPLRNPNELRQQPNMGREHVFERVAACWNLRAPEKLPPARPRRYRRPQYVPVYQVRSLS